MGDGNEMPADELSALDATFLELEEADQSAHMHIGAVMIFQPPPGTPPPPLEAVRADLEERLDLLPRFRQRLSAPHTGGLHWPRWVDDDRFEISNHVRAAALPAPAGEDDLREWAGEYFAQRLDRARPLWEIVVVSLGDGRWAMATKTHHCIVDGVGSVDISHTLLDTQPKPAPRRPVSGAGQGAAQSIEADREQAMGLGRFGELGLGAARGIAHAAATGADVALHPAHARDALERAGALVKVIVRDELVAAPRTSLNEPIGAARRLAVVEASLDELKEIKRSLGGTVNDVVLAATATGLRRLLLSRGEALPPEGLRAMVPVNIRSAAERLALGNKITSLFVHLIVDEDDPLSRYRRQLEEAEGLKSSDQAVGSRQIVDLAAHAPPVIHTFLARSLFATRLFNVTVTNVPGPQAHLYAFGSRLVAVWPLVPLAAEHAVGLAVLSYAGRVFFCLNVARDSVPDVDLVARGIEDSLVELGTLAAADSAHAGTR